MQWGICLQGSLPPDGGLSQGDSFPPGKRYTPPPQYSHLVAATEAGSYIRSYCKQISNIYHLRTEASEGYVFTGVCHSFCSTGRGRCCNTKGLWTTPPSPPQDQVTTPQHPPPGPGGQHPPPPGTWSQHPPPPPGPGHNTPLLPPGPGHNTPLPPGPDGQQHPPPGPGGQHPPPPPPGHGHNTPK